MRALLPLLLLTRSITLAGLSITLVALTATLTLSTTLLAQVPLQVMTTDGLVTGATTDNTAVQVWRGLPYAAPPVGANRWREPQAVAAWSGVRDATRFASRCIQRGFAPGAEQALASEDCLYLNVWSAATSSEALLPVLVWIHGGGFFGGSGSDAIYDATSLAAKGAVVVTFNYRLGTFGFLAHPELTAESPNHSSGNYAMLDMVAVLEWVYDNIAAFGGDPINITLVGESAGAQAVGNLLASPLSAGLFHHAILQSSGWMGFGIAKPPTLAEHEVLGSTQAAAFGAASLIELRQATTQQIYESFPNNGSINVDGYFLTQDPTLTFAAGAHHPVDILAGSNMNEAAFFGPGLQTAQELRDYAANKYGPLAADFLRIYPAGDDTQANQSYLQSFSDEMAWHLRQLGQYQAPRGLGTWIYFFTHVPPGQEARGATHVSELAYMFNQSAQNANWTDTDRTLADTMASYWVNFAARSNPNGQSLPVWPAYRANEPGHAMVLGDVPAAETEMVPSAAALEFFAAAYARHVEGLRP